MNRKTPVKLKVTSAKRIATNFHETNLLNRQFCWRNENMEATKPRQN